MRSGPDAEDQPSGWSTPAPRREPPRALDDHFVRAATVHELSAAERQAQASPSPAARSARRPLRARLADARAWFGSIAAVVLLATLAVAPGAVGATATAPPMPDRLQLVLAVPEGVEPSPSLIAAVQHEALLATGWLEAQTGRTFRGSLAQAVVVPIRLPDAPLPGTPVAATEQIERAVDLRDIDPSVMPVIATTLGLADAPDTCGTGGPFGVVVFLGNCWTPASSATRDFGRGVNRTIAHELVHALGGVPACAPNSDSGHVTDDPADLMAAVAYLGSGTVTLDAAGDDYFARDGTVCRSILDSPLWQR